MVVLSNFDKSMLECVGVVVLMEKQHDGTVCVKLSRHGTEQNTIAGTDKTKILDFFHCSLTMECAHTT